MSFKDQLHVKFLVLCYMKNMTCVFVKEITLPRHKKKFGTLRKIVSDSGIKTNRCNRIPERVRRLLFAFYTDSFSRIVSQFCNCFPLILLFCTRPVNFMYV